VVTSVLDKLRVFRISCGCSAVGEAVVGLGAVVLEKVRVFSCVCMCSR